jgi:translation initiation factor IF-2
MLTRPRPRPRPAPPAQIDKEGANVERVKQQLTELELVPEEWGGKTPMVAISAKKGTGVDELLETVLLVAELEELAANPDRAARGTVLEASLDRKLGPLATVLVQNGTLRVGDAVAAGGAHGRVRAMAGPSGAAADAAGPSTAVQVLGLSAVPQAGDEFDVFPSESEARAAAEAVDDARRLERLAEMAGGGSMVTMSSLASMDEEGEEGGQALQRMNIILKADTSGACEAVKAALAALPQDSVVLRYLLAAPGEVTASDVDLAAASGGVVLGFNVQPPEAVLAAAKRAGVELRAYDVIYDLVDDARAAMEGRLRAVEERVALGAAEVLQTFGSGARRAAGCGVKEGLLRAGCLVSVRRGRRVVYEGRLTSLRRVKDDVREVEAGAECGVVCEGFRDWEAGDKLDAYEVVEKRLRLEEAHAATATMAAPAAAAAAAAAAAVAAAEP